MTTPPRAEAASDRARARFADEAHRQSLAVAQSRHDREDQDFIDAISAEIGAAGYAPHADKVGVRSYRRACSAARRAASTRGSSSQ